MDYAAHYRRLITLARNRALSGYFERHHVRPRCIGGDDASENIVTLTPEEHYVAHQLLVKMYPGHIGLLWAANAMTGARGDVRRNNKSFGWLRRGLAAKLRGKKRDPALVAKVAEALRGRTLSPEHRAKISAFFKSFPRTEEHRARIGKANRNRSPATRALIAERMRGNTYGRDKKRPEDAIERTAAAHRGKPKSDIHRARLSAAHKGKTLSAETRVKVSASLLGNQRTLGYKHSDESRAKMSASRRGMKRGSMSEETKAKISAANTGRIRHTLEAREKMSVSRRGVAKSPEHRKKIGAANRVRWERWRVARASLAMPSRVC